MYIIAMMDVSYVSQCVYKYQYLIDVFIRSDYKEHESAGQDVNRGNSQPVIVTEQLKRWNCLQWL